MFTQIYTPMKIALTFILFLMLFSCKHSDCTNGIKDGDETGIDCGGDCPNCTIEVEQEINNEEEHFYVDSVFNQNETFQKLQGLWHTNSKIIRAFNANNDTIEATLHVNKNYHPKTFFSDTIDPNTLFYFLNVKGKIREEDYPDANFYSFDTINNEIMINNNYHLYSILNITNDSLNLKLGNDNSDVSFEYNLARNKTIYSSSETINWNVELQNSYPTPNELNIRIAYEDDSQIPLQIILIPIQPGQLNYTGSIDLGISNNSNLTVSIIKEDLNNPNTLIIDLKSTLQWRDNIINTSTIPLQIDTQTSPLNFILFQ